MRDIRNMLDDLELNERSFASVYVAGNGEKRTEYVLPKDLTLTLVSGYSAPMRFAIVTRLQELEAEKAPPVGFRCGCQIR
jgi:hypothetical protein